jgi:hypothetical protein
MTHVFAYLFGFFACGALWLLREIERREVLEDLCERNETLLEMNAALRKENEEMRRAQETCRRIIGGVHDGLGQLREEISLGGKAPLPAAAEQSGQQLAVRVTTQLPSLANFAGPR